MKVRVTDDRVTDIYLSNEDVSQLVTARMLGFDDKHVKRPWVKEGDTVFVIGLEDEPEKKKEKRK